MCLSEIEKCQRDLISQPSIDAKFVEVKHRSLGKHAIKHQATANLRKPLISNNSFFKMRWLISEHWICLHFLSNPFKGSTSTSMLCTWCLLVGLWSLFLGATQMVTAKNSKVMAHARNADSNRPFNVYDDCFPMENFHITTTCVKFSKDCADNKSFFGHKTAIILKSIAN